MASDGADLSMEILELLKNSALRQEMGKHAREVITQNQGGTEDVLKIINKFLISPG
jgi:3-deoxy-D-manno-octulosonic-acid transferase